MLEFLTIGDPHLGKIANHFPASHLELQIAELEKACDYAVKNGIQHVFDLGDISDQPHLSEAARVMLLEHYLKYDGKFERDVFLGNHDVKDRHTHSLMTFSRLEKRHKLKSVHIHKDPIQKTYEDIPVNILPFPHTRPLKSKGESVNFAHLTRPGTLSDNGSKNKSGVSCKDTNIWVIGHLHTRQILDRNFYPGNMYQTGFGEVDSKGFSVFTIKKNGKRLSVTETFFDTNSKFKFLTIDVEKEEDLEKIDNNLLYKYRIKTDIQHLLPPDLKGKYPNLVEILPLTKASKKNAEDIKIEISENVNIIEDSLRYAKEQGMSKENRKRLNVALKKLIQDNNLNEVV